MPQTNPTVQLNYSLLLLFTIHFHTLLKSEKKQHVLQVKWCISTTNAHKKLFLLFYIWLYWNQKL